MLESLVGASGIQRPPRWAPAGFSYRPRPVTHGIGYQVKRLLASDVDPQLLAGSCEVGLFGLDCFTAMVQEGFDIDGYVFLSQVYRSILPVRLGDALTLMGHVRSLQEVSAGHLVSEYYVLHDSEGRACIETELTGLLRDPLGAERDRSAAPAIRRRGDLPAATWVKVQDKVLTPEKVRVFSEDVGNAIHFDPEYARRCGFRAPLAQGVMSAVWLMSTLCQDGLPTSFDVEVRYLRPVFWDSAATLWVSHAEDGKVAMARSLNEDGKPTADMRVRELSYGPRCTGR